MPNYSFDAWKSEDPAELEVEETDFLIEAEFPDPDLEHDRLWEEVLRDRHLSGEGDDF